MFWGVVKNKDIIRKITDLQDIHYVCNAPALALPQRTTSQSPHHLASQTDISFPLR